MVKANFKQNAILESLDTLFESGYDPSNIKINPPFNKYYKVATIKDLQDTGADVNSDSDVAAFIADDPCSEAYSIVGYAVVKPEYVETLGGNGLDVMCITDTGDLCYNVGDRVYDASIDEILDALGESESINEDETYSYNNYKFDSKEEYDKFEKYEKRYLEDLINNRISNFKEMIHTDEGKEVCTGNYIFDVKGNRGQSYTWELIYDSGEPKLYQGYMPSMGEINLVKAAGGEKIVASELDRIKDNLLNEGENINEYKDLFPHPSVDDIISDAKNECKKSGKTVYIYRAKEDGMYTFSEKGPEENSNKEFFDYFGKVKYEPGEYVAHLEDGTTSNLGEKDNLKENDGFDDLLSRISDFKEINYDGEPSGDYGFKVKGTRGRTYNWELIHRNGKPYLRRGLQVSMEEVDLVNNAGGEDAVAQKLDSIKDSLLNNTNQNINESYQG